MLLVIMSETVPTTISLEELPAPLGNLIRKIDILRRKEGLDAGALQTQVNRDVNGLLRDSGISNGKFDVALDFSDVGTLTEQVRSLYQDLILAPLNIGVKHVATWIPPRLTEIRPVIMTLRSSPDYSSFKDRQIWKLPKQELIPILKNAAITLLGSTKGSDWLRELRGIDYFNKTRERPTGSLRELLCDYVFCIPRKELKEEREVTETGGSTEVTEGGDQTNDESTQGQTCEPSTKKKEDVFKKAPIFKVSLAGMKIPNELPDVSGVGELPDRMKEVFLLYYGYGKGEKSDPGSYRPEKRMTQEQVAQRLKMIKSSVYQNLQRSVLILQEYASYLATQPKPSPKKQDAANIASNNRGEQVGGKIPMSAPVAVSSSSASTDIGIVPPKSISRLFLGRPITDHVILAILKALPILKDEPSETPVALPETAIVTVPVSQIKKSLPVQTRTTEKVRQIVSMMRPVLPPAPSRGFGYQNPGRRIWGIPFRVKEKLAEDAARRSEGSPEPVSVEKSKYEVPEFADIQAALAWLKGKAEWHTLLDSVTKAEHDLAAMGLIGSSAPDLCATLVAIKNTFNCKSLVAIATAVLYPERVNMGGNTNTSPQESSVLSAVSLQDAPKPSPEPARDPATTQETVAQPIQKPVIATASPQPLMPPMLPRPHHPDIPDSITDYESFIDWTKHQHRILQRFQGIMNFRDMKIVDDFMISKNFSTGTIWLAVLMLARYFEPKKRFGDVVLDICLSKKKRFPHRAVRLPEVKKAPVVIAASSSVADTSTSPTTSVVPVSHGPDIHGLEPQDAIPLLLEFIEDDDIWIKSVMDIFSQHEQGEYEKFQTDLHAFEHDQKNHELVLIIKKLIAQYAKLQPNVKIESWHIVFAIMGARVGSETRAIYQRYDWNIQIGKMLEGDKSFKRIIDTGKDVGTIQLIDGLRNIKIKVPRAKRHWFSYDENTAEQTNLYDVLRDLIYLDPRDAGKDAPISKKELWAKMKKIKLSE